MSSHLSPQQEDVVGTNEKTLGHVVSEGCLKWKEAVLVDGEYVLRSNASLIDSFVLNDPNSIDDRWINHERRVSRVDHLVGERKPVLDEPKEVALRSPVKG